MFREGHGHIERGGRLDLKEKARKIRRGETGQPPRRVWWREEVPPPRLGDGEVGIRVPPTPSDSGGNSPCLRASVCSSGKWEV